MMTLEDKVNKYALMVFDGILIILGIVALSLGFKAANEQSQMAALTKVQSSSENPKDPGLLRGAAQVLIAGGFLLLGAGAIGCWGAYKENKQFLKWCAIILTLLVVMQFIAGIVAIMMKGKLEKKMKYTLKQNIVYNYDGKRDSKYIFSRALDYAQVHFSCCGIDSYKDFYRATKWPKRRSKAVPLSCCVLRNKQQYYDHNIIIPQYNSCPDEPTIGNSNLGMACYEFIKDWLIRKANTVIGLTFGVIMAEIFGVMMSINLIDYITAMQKRQAREARHAAFSNATSSHHGTHHHTEHHKESHHEGHHDTHHEGHQEGHHGGHEDHGGGHHHAS